MDDIMRKFTTAQSCEREIILIALQIRHQKELCCCDYHKVHCNCLTCVENTLIADEMEDVSLEAQSDVQSTSLSRHVTLQRKNAIRADLEDYSISLHFGKSSVGGVTINRL